MAVRGVRVNPILDLPRSLVDRRHHNSEFSERLVKMSSPSSAVEMGSQTPESKPSTTPASSPPAADSFEDELDPDFLLTKEEKIMREEEQKIQAETDKKEEQRKKRVLKKTGPLTRDERDTKAHELNELLAKSEVFSKILTGKTKFLGRVGTNMDGTSAAIGEHHLEMTKQPESMIGGTMRDYQLEGLTWMGGDSSSRNVWNLSRRDGSW